VIANLQGATPEEVEAMEAMERILFRAALSEARRILALRKAGVAVAKEQEDLAVVSLAIGMLAEDVTKRMRESGAAFYRKIVENLPPETPEEKKP
jgi:hypothetical protein